MESSLLCKMLKSAGARLYTYSWGTCGNEAMLDSVLTLEDQVYGLSMTELTNSREFSDGVGVRV